VYSYRNILYGIYHRSRGFFVPKGPIKLADLEVIGSRIRELRGEILQEELAAYLGISQGQLSKIERGKLGPTAEVLLRLAEKFGKSTDWMLTGKI
jgi:DNA-binding XRE family transcriptional regulator